MSDAPRSPNPESRGSPDEIPGEIPGEIPDEVPDEVPDGSAVASDQPGTGTNHPVGVRTPLARRFNHGFRRSASACKRGICVCHPFCDFREDERAIEGLPIRLVIALVVGVASLSVMMSMIAGIGGLAVTELDAQPDPEVTSPGEQEMSIAVVAPDGDRIAGATVIVRAGTARLDGVATATTDDSGVATLTVAPALGPNQPDGTLTIDIKPPAGSEYADDQQNTRILVVEEG